MRRCAEPGLARGLESRQRWGRGRPQPILLGGHKRNWQCDGKQTRRYIVSQFSAASDGTAANQAVWRLKAKRAEAVLTHVSDVVVLPLGLTLALVLPDALDAHDVLLLVQNRATGDATWSLASLRSRHFRKVCRESLPNLVKHYVLFRTRLVD